MQRDDAAGERPITNLSEPVPLEQLCERVGVGEAPHARRQVRVGRAAGEHLAEERHDAVEPDAIERGEAPARRRDLEDAEPTTDAKDAPQLADPGGEVLDVPHTEADGHGVERRVVEGQREHVALHELDLGRLFTSELEHALGEVEPDDIGAVCARLDCKVACAAAGVERSVARPHRLLDRDAPPLTVEAGRHDAVHRVVDRSDPVEHLADALRRKRPGLHAGHCPHRFVSVFSSPSWSSARPTTKSTRFSTVSAPW